jgi:hypothetical protein
VKTPILYKPLFRPEPYPTHIGYFHPDIIPKKIPGKIKNYLNKVPSEIKNYFSTEKLLLELNIDPEISGYKTLTVYLPTDINVDVELVFDALIEIKEQWIADVSSTILSKISISLRFQQI